MTPSADLRVDVINAFAALKEALTAFYPFFIEDANLIGWLEGYEQYPDQEARIQMRLTAFDAMSQLEYTSDQGPRDILICSGFFGASEKTLEKLTALHDAKNAFKESILTLKRSKTPLNDKFLTAGLGQRLNARDSKVAYTLNQAKLGRLHLKQCYRRMPILARCPTRISWTWAHTRAIKKLSIEEAHTLLLKKGLSPGIELQIQKLSQLQLNEPLAIVQELAPHLRANVVLIDPDVGRQRVMVKGPVPIFFPACQSDPMPTFIPPAPKQEKDPSRPVRNDVQLDPSPFLPAIRAHRYNRYSLEEKAC